MVELMAGPWLIPHRPRRQSARSVAALWDSVRAVARPVDRASIRMAIRCRRCPPTHGAACPTKATVWRPAPRITTARPMRAHVLPVAGSQAAIRALPSLLPRATVAIAPLTYSEYAPAFERAGHRIVPLDIACDALPDDVTHAVVVNPNNPTADHLSAAKLLQWHAQLTRTRRHAGGRRSVRRYDAWRRRLPPARTAPGLVVLRSPGKFFGLAGVRAGFVLSDAGSARRDCARCSAHGPSAVPHDMR